MTTSCCPGYVETVEKHVPKMKPYVSETPSPMRYAAEMDKEQFPGTKTVFIGYCIGKRKEAIRNHKVDFVLSFEELVINGIDKKAVGLMKAYAKGKAPANFIEFMSCEGGCINGPASLGEMAGNRNLLNMNLQ